MDIAQFGQTIKQKYPEYQDMDDADLGQRMLSKYPQYQDMITAPTQPVQPQQDITTGLGIGLLKGAGSTLESGLRSGGQIVGGIGGAVSVPIQERQQADLTSQYEQLVNMAKTASPIEKSSLLTKAREIQGQIQKAGQPSQAFGTMFDNPLLAKAREFLQPKTTAEKVGYGAEKIGEFVLGSRGLTKMASEGNIVKTGVELLKSKNAWNRIGGAIMKDIPSAAGSFLTSMAQSGAGTGEIKEAGTSIKRAGVSAGIDLGTSAALQVGKEAINALAKKPALWINNLIGVRKGELSYGKNPGEQIAQDRITANSVEDLGNKITSKLDDLHNQSKTVMSQAKKTGVRVDMTPTVNSIDESIKFEKGNLKNIDPTIKSDAKKKIEVLMELKNNLIKKLGKNVKNVDPDTANEVKKMLGSTTKWTPETASYVKTMNMAKVKAYGATRQAIETVVPDIAPINEAFSNYIAADHAINRVLDAAKNYKEPLLSGQSLFKRGIGGLIGYGTTRDWKGAVIGGLLEPYAMQVMNSPTVITQLSSVIKSLSPNDIKTLAENSPTIFESLLKSGAIQSATGLFNSK